MSISPLYWPFSSKHPLCPFRHYNSDCKPKSTIILTQLNDAITFENFFLQILSKPEIFRHSSLLEKLSKKLPRIIPSTPCTTIPCLTAHPLLSVIAPVFSKNFENKSYLFLCSFFRLICFYWGGGGWKQNFLVYVAVRCSVIYCIQTIIFL